MTSMKPRRKQQRRNSITVSSKQTLWNKNASTIWFVILLLLPNLSVLFHNNNRNNAVFGDGNGIIFVSAMRLVVQRAKGATVTATVQDEEGSKEIASIGPGLVALVGIHENDTKEDLQYCCNQLLGCKLWPNDNGTLWRHSVRQRNMDVLCISVFTIYGTLSKKNKQPDYKLSMKPNDAKILYREFIQLLEENYDKEKVHDGIFGISRDVTIINDGPATIVIESSPKESSSPEVSSEE